jgi:hypothetical protein
MVWGRVPGFGSWWWGRGGRRDRAGPAVLVFALALGVVTDPAVVTGVVAAGLLRAELAVEPGTDVLVWVVVAPQPAMVRLTMPATRVSHTRLRAIATGCHRG